MEHIKVGSIVQVIKTGRIGAVVTRKRSDVIVAFYDKSFMSPEDLTFKERELKIVELPKIMTSELRAFVCGDISLAEISNGTNLIDERAKENSEEYRRTFMPELSIIPERQWTRSFVGSIPSCCW